MISLFGFAIGFQEMMIIMVVGVLLFGRRLPEVGKQLGKGIVEFKKGLKGIEDDIDSNINTNYNKPQDIAAEPPKPPQRLGTTAPKFEEGPTDSEGKPRA